MAKLVSKTKKPIAYRTEHAVKRFTCLMNSMQRPVELTCENMLAFISHLSLANYSNEYCRLVTRAVMRHPCYASMGPTIMTDCRVIEALSNAGQQSPLEDK